MRAICTRGICLLGLASALWLSSAASHAAGRTVAFRALDGRTMTGLLLEGDARPAPAVVLVPMLGRPKEEWQAVAERLVAAGISALAIDLPGASVPPGAAELARWHEDIQAAVTYLTSQPADVHAGRVGVLGASLGANLAVVAAASDSRIRSIALVSPSLEYRGLRAQAALQEYGSRPALLIASLRDPYAARSVRELAAESPGIRQLRWSDAPAHGTVLLARDPDIVRSIVEWFQWTLG